MALLPILRQPIQIKPFDEVGLSCDTPAPFCSLYKTGDYFRLQMKQTPCGSDLLCNPDFDFDANLITNGAFTGSAAGWTLNSGWVYNSNTIVHSGGPGGSVASQNIPGLVVGQTYYVTFTVSGISDAMFIQLGGTASGFITTNGTFSIPIVAGGSGTLLEISAVYDVTIDDVSLNTIDCWFAGEGWVFGDDAACHTPGAASQLYADIYSSIINGDYMVVAYAVFGMSAGQLEVYVAGSLVRTVTQNGTYTDYITTTASDSALAFTADADFDGCVTVDYSYKLLSVAELQSAGSAIVDSDGVVVLSSLNVALNEDRVNYYIGSGALPNGCYYMVIPDSCTALTGAVEINSDVPFSNAGIWSFEKSEVASSVTITGGNLECTDGPIVPSNYTALQSYVFPDGDTFYSVLISITTGAMTDPSAVECSVVFPSSNGSAIATKVIVEVDSFDNTTYTFQGIVLVSNGTSGTYHNKFGIYLESRGSGSGVNNITAASVKIFTPATGANNVFVSNCLQVLDDVGDALLVWGESDAAHALGFIFDANFPRLESRLFVSFTNPHDGVNQNNYLYSTGAKKKTFAQLEGLYDLQFLSVDQNMHMVIAAMLSSDHFRMGTALTPYREYIWMENKYEPLWVKKSGTGVAESSVEVARITSTVFN